MTLRFVIDRFNPVWFVGNSCENPQRGSAGNVEKIDALRVAISLIEGSRRARLFVRNVGMRRKEIRNEDRHGSSRFTARLRHCDRLFDRGCARPRCDLGDGSFRETKTVEGSVKKKKPLNEEETWKKQHLKLLKNSDNYIMVYISPSGRISMAAAGQQALLAHMHLVVHHRLIKKIAEDETK